MDIKPDLPHGLIYFTPAVTVTDVCVLTSTVTDMKANIINSKSMCNTIKVCRCEAKMSGVLYLPLCKCRPAVEG